jgi:hypothetical protein
VPNNLVVSTGGIMGLQPTQEDEKHADQETVGAPYLAERDVGGVLNYTLPTGRDRRRPEAFQADRQGC